MQLVIIGAGPAGLTVGEGVRQHSFDADITMLSTEPYPPYAPPAMADFFITGREDSIFWKGRDVCDRLEIDYRQGTRVESVQPKTKTVALASGATLSYDKLVVASGSSLYAPIEGAKLHGVSNFKSLSAATRLVDAVHDGRATSALIVGAGFIGVEVALLLADLGVTVTMVEMMDRVMPRMLDIETADVVLHALRQRGVDVRLETKAGAFQGSERVESLELESGESLTADEYVAATGVKPNVDYLEGSGIDVGWGVRVDERLDTNVTDVVAVGDVAETFDRFSGERYVHAIFPNAVAQGQVVADRLAGFDRVYEGAETMNSLKHLGVPVMAVGMSSGAEELRWKAGDSLRKIFLEEGRIVGFRIAGDIGGAGVLRSLMVRGTDVSEFGERLVDPSFGVADLAFRTGVLA